MRKNNKLWLGLIALLALASCAEESLLDYVVDKPASVAALEYLNDYDVLKSYVDRNANPNFKLGAGVLVDEFNKKGLSYSHLVSNFDEVTAVSEMKHAAIVQADGSLNLTRVQNFVSTAKEAGISIFGHTLVWHMNQNAAYLKKTIAPTIIPAASGPIWEVVSSNDFESDNAANYQGNAGAEMSFTAAGHGAAGNGRALQIINATVRTNDWDSQLFFTFPTPTVTGQKFVLEMDIKADAPATFPTQAHTTPGGYKHYDFFGQISATTEWVHFSKEVTIADNTSGCSTIAFNLGATATTYYFDNIKLSFYNTKVGAKTIEKTPQEKDLIIGGELERWIAGTLEVTKGYVTTWNVVNEPMDDIRPYELKTGIGKAKLAADEFYWQDYLGKDYAVKAFKLARQYGNPNDIHFINEINLESNIDKCKGLIEYVKYIESKGAQVDGIGTQMHLTLVSDKDMIVEMFTLLAATGKIIKVSELDLGVGVKTVAATDEQYIAQAELYKFVVQKYLELIPAAQRYGITVWSPMDSPVGSSWKAGEPIGLWNEGYNRKRAYGGFADGLSGK